MYTRPAVSRMNVKTVKKILLLALGIMLLVLPGHALAADTSKIKGKDQRHKVRDQYIVVLKDTVPVAPDSGALADTLTRKYGGKVKYKYKRALKGYTTKITEAQAEKLSKDPLVKYVEQDSEVTTLATQSNAVWGLDRIDQRSLPLNQSFTYPGMASNVTAYVIDSGINISHQEFDGRAVNGYDIIENNVVAQDCNGHGTHVAGTLGGNTYGVAKGVKLVAVRVLDCTGKGTWSGVIAGIDWVTNNHNGPSVANLSVGGGTNTATNDAVKRSIAAGVTYAVAAGNGNTNACNTTPGGVNEAITVGNVTRTDARYTNSNYGSCIDIWAPGTGITSAYHTTNTATASLTGTSMAAPHVAGAAILALANNPTYTPQELRDQLVGNATNGVLTGINTGSPNKLVFIENGTTPTPQPPAGCGPFTNANDVGITDFGTSSSKVVVSSCTGNASSTSKVSVDIKHTYRGDLKLTLLAPDGTQYLLKQANSGDSADNIQQAFTVNLSNEQRNGTWQLRIYDNARHDQGYLDSWSLSL